MGTQTHNELRMTGNRQVVLEVLRNTTAHPTAQQVFLAAREQQPQIGFATVYRTLDLLVQHGLAQEVYRDRDGAAHYDANVSRHDHAICDRCGTIADVSAPLHALAYAIIERSAGFRIDWHATAFTGLCAACAAQEN
jgi:Fur family ferric uptake transcriptional regulator/Fur family peroxide stress response transcriptional regulator